MSLHGFRSSHCGRLTLGGRAAGPFDGGGKGLFVNVLASLGDGFQEGRLALGTAAATAAVGWFALCAPGCWFLGGQKFLELLGGQIGVLLNGHGHFFGKLELQVVLGGQPSVCRGTGASQFVLTRHPTFWLCVCV